MTIRTACEQMSRKHKALLQYQTVKTGQGEIEATITEMTLQQIKQRSEYFNSQNSVFGAGRRTS